MSGIESLLDKMRRTKSGWTYADLDTLYRGLGFKVREGGKHCIYIHSRFPQLRAAVTRHRSLAKGYIEHALHLADKLSELEAKYGK